MSFFLSLHFDTAPDDLSTCAIFSNQITDAALKSACETAEFDDKAGNFLCVHLPDAAVLVIGTGTGADSDDDGDDVGGGGFETESAAEKAGGKFYKQLSKKPFFQLQIDLASLPDNIAAHFLHGAYLASYGFQSYFTKADEKQTVALYVSGLSAAGRAQLAQLEHLASGVGLARDLVYEPANKLYPASYAERCKPLAALGLEITVLDEPEMEALGMGALLGVGQGSARSSHCVIMHWKGGKDEAPVALIGKGVSFDTGGISLKPAKGMEDMKWDMGGSAAVVGAMCAIAGRKTPRNVVGMIGLVENMPDGNAQRPGDVVTSMSGQTIEVINTDAEGRLVLADVLTYAQRTFKPQAIIDLATLTGAVIGALGKEYAGLFSNQDALAAQLESASQQTSEKLWRLPVGAYYDKQLKSHIADMKNIGGPWGGASSAAAFIQRFIEDDMAWAHLDIAGKAWSETGDAITPSGGTGYGVRLLTRLIEDWPA